MFVLSSTHSISYYVRYCVQKIKLAVMRSKMKGVT